MTEEIHWGLLQMEWLGQAPAGASSEQKDTFLFSGPNTAGGQG